MTRTPRRLSISWCLVTGLALLIGCSTSQPARFYTLSSLQPVDRHSAPRAGAAELLVGVGPVSLPAYLDRPQIVTRPSPNRIEMSEFHRWAGGLKQSFPRILTEAISDHLGSRQVAAWPWRERIDPDYRVAVTVLQFDGRLADSVELVATWRIFQPPQQGALAADGKRIQMTVGGDGYEALVDAHSRAVDSLGRTIAETIVELAKKAQPDR